MRYAPKQYAAALFKVLAVAPEKEQKKILKRFLSLLIQKGDTARLGFVLREVERQYLQSTRMKKVAVETPDVLSRAAEKNIKDIVGGGLILQQKINPALLAGIKILINDELLVDASAETRLKRLFKK